NPHHLLKPYSSFSEAMKSADVQNYVGTLRRTHPFEKAEKLLQGSGQGVDAGSGTRKETPAAHEELKVFQLKDASDEPKAGQPRSGPHLRPPLSPQPPQTSPPLHPPGAGETYPVHREAYPFLDRVRAARPEREDREPKPGA